MFDNFGAKGMHAYFDKWMSSFTDFFTEFSGSLIILLSPPKLEVFLKLPSFAFETDILRREGQKTVKISKAVQERTLEMESF